MPYHDQPHTLGARQRFAPRPSQNIDMGHWAGDPAQGLSLPQLGNNNDAWLSGRGGMPSQLPGYGASSNMGDAYRNLSSIMNPNRYVAHPMMGNVSSETVPSIYADPSGGGSNFASKIPSMNLGGGGGDWQFGAGRLGADAPWRQELAAKGTSWLDSLGGWGGIANIGMKGYGLYQTGQQIDDLRDWRGKLNRRADASAALDREKFGLVKEEYDTLKTARKANLWAQRPQDPNANPYTNQLVQGA